MFDLTHWQRQFFPTTDRCIHICWSEKEPAGSSAVVGEARNNPDLELYFGENTLCPTTYHRPGMGQFPFLYVDIFHTVTENVSSRSTEEYFLTQLAGSRFQIRGGWLSPERAEEMLRDVFDSNSDRKTAVKRYERGVTSFEMELRKNECLNYLCIARDPMPGFLLETDPSLNLPIVA